MSDSPAQTSRARLRAGPRLHRYRRRRRPASRVQGGHPAPPLLLRRLPLLRRSADFSAIDGLSSSDAVALVAVAVDTAASGLEYPSWRSLTVRWYPVGETTWGRSATKPRKLKLDISDTELVEVATADRVATTLARPSRGHGDRRLHPRRGSGGEVRCIAGACNAATVRHSRTARRRATLIP